MKKLAGFLVLSILFSAQASAEIESGAVTGGQAQKKKGTFVKLNVPFKESKPVNTVGNDNFNNWNLYGFDEDQNAVTKADLKVDLLADGSGGQKTGPGVIPKDTKVASHYIFFDAPGGALSNTVLGTVNFDSNILGIIFTSGRLAQSDYLANTGVTYRNPGARGFEAAHDEWVSITGPKQITVKMVSGSPGDYFRVLTEHSPAPPVAPTPPRTL